MEEKRIIERYGFFNNEIKRLSKISLHQSPGISDIDMSKPAIQAAYRDLKAEKNLFADMGIIDYLCWLSSEMFLKRWLEDCSKEIFKENGKYNIIKALLFNLVPQNTEILNLLRLSFKETLFFLNESIFYRKIKQLDKSINDKKIFLIFMEYRYYLDENFNETHPENEDYLSQAPPFISSVCLINELDTG